MRYEYLNDSNQKFDEFLKERINFNSSLPLHILEVPTMAISPLNSEWVQCVEARKEKELLRLRIISNTYRGVTVTVPCNGESMYLKYRDLRFLVRNNSKVLITFPKVFIQKSIYGMRNLYLLAYDFKVCNPSIDILEPKIKI